MIDSDELVSGARELLPDVVGLRRALHACPELGNQLPGTRRLVLEALSPLGLDVDLSETTSSFVATVRGGKPGRCILLRADMDALPMPEDSGVAFASQNSGAMHACGHDAHTAMLVGAARLLAARRDAFAGDVKLFFQTGEEGHFGARLCLDEGLLERGREPEAAFALHIDTRLPVGRLASRGGPLMASADVWRIEVKGRGGHASMPHDAADPIPAACEIVNALQTMVTRHIHARDPIVITTTKIDAGTTDNVIPETARLLGTMRATSERSRKLGEEGIHRVAFGIAQAHGVEATVHIDHGYPVTVNDAGVVELARSVAGELLGDRAYIGMPDPVMGAEDFSYVLQRWPGAMVFLGARPADTADPAPVHSNRMVLNEEGMQAGIAMHAGVALRFLASAD